MSTKDRRSVWGTFLDRAFKAKDEKEKEEIKKEVEDAMKNGDDDPTNPLGHHFEIHNHANPDPNMSVKDAEPETKEKLEKLEKKVDDGFKAINDSIAKIADSVKGKDAKDENASPNREILGELEFEAPAGIGDKASKATDSVYLEDSFKETVASAEILAPGIRTPTFDTAAKPLKTFLDICNLRRKALDFAYRQADTQGMIDQVLGGRALDTSEKATCGDIRMIFNASAAMKKRANNDKDASGANKIGDFKPNLTGAIKSIADINKANEEFWRKKRTA